MAGEANLSPSHQPKVALVFTEELKTYREVLPFGQFGSPEFKIGLYVQESLRDAVSSIYPETKEVDVTPAGGAYD